jgi:hypothetical protein
MVRVRVSASRADGPPVSSSLIWILAIAEALAQAAPVTPPSLDLESVGGGAGAGFAAALVAIIGQLVMRDRAASHKPDTIDHSQQAEIAALRDAHQQTAIALARIETRMERTNALADDLRDLAATSAALAQEVRVIAAQSRGSP